MLVKTLALVGLCAFGSALGAATAFCTNNTDGTGGFYDQVTKDCCAASKSQFAVYDQNSHMCLGSIQLSAFAACCTAKGAGSNSYG